MFEIVKTYQVKNSKGYIYILNGKRAATFAKSEEALRASLGITQRQWIAVMSAAAQVVELPANVSRELAVAAIEEIEALNPQGPDFYCLDRQPRSSNGVHNATQWDDFYWQLRGFDSWCSRFSDDFYLANINEMFRLIHT